jgi:O-antigen/teichoic acid export membrane protein
MQRQLVMAPSLKRNVIANGLGQGWRALMSFAFIPLYIKFLGVEAYGLIGIFALLQAWLVLLDIGMRPALAREMARFTGGAHNAQSIRDLLRSVEMIGAGVAGVIAVGIWAASGSLAADWLRAENLPEKVVAQALAAMGVVTALRFVEDLYVSCLAGLELQVQQNTIIAITASVRGLGAIAVLAWISPTITAFFIWQGLVSLVTVALFAGLVYSTLPSAPRSARPSRAALGGVWHFAAGMMAITVLSLLLTQSDKILLSRLLSLKAYGYYALAGTVANGLGTMSAPITAAFYPRLTALTTIGNEVAARVVYHQGAQLVTVFMGASAVILIVFREEVMLVWTGDPVLVRQVAPLVAVLALGTLLNGLMAIPYQMMLAHGWTTLPIKVNTTAVAILVPAILWVVPRYGAIGAACIWVILNAGYVLFAISLMHRRLLRGEKWRWYFQDVLIPLGAAAGAALVCRTLISGHRGRIEEIGELAGSAVCTLFAGAMAAPTVRSQIARYMTMLQKPLVPAAVPGRGTEGSR